MRTLTVALGARSYPIHIGSGILTQVDLIVDKLKSSRVAVVTNVTIARLYLEPLVRALEANGVSVVEVVLPDGEAYKNWQSLNAIFDALLAARCDRGTTLLALGGGVIGDLAGFASACYQRGVGFIQLPTTLLAQVDSSVGGKTGINHPLGKNMIGAFHQPRAVIADADTLDTLPDRELRAGLAEVIKYGLIRDSDFFDWLEVSMDRLLSGDKEALAFAIERSCRNKAEVVAEDETESGVRALLNLGHTFGHAIEAGLGYGEWLHGEAVAAGTVMAADLSRRQGRLGDGEFTRIERLLARAGLPTRGPRLGATRYLDLMGLDKKVIDGRLRLVLLEAIGRAVVSSDATTAELTATIEACSRD